MRKVYVLIVKFPNGTMFVSGVYSSLKKARHEMMYVKPHIDKQEYFIETHVLL